jgi:hypothetical protein
MVRPAVAGSAIRQKAELRMALLVDRGQESGEIATQERNPGNVGNRVAVTAPATLEELGIPRQRLSEARKLAPDVRAGGIGIARTSQSGDSAARRMNGRGQVASVRHGPWETYWAG